MPRPCHAEHEPRPETCRLCWLDANHPGYQLLWRTLPTTRVALCRHLGEEVRREVCPTCRGVVQLKVLACARHKECTIGKELPGIACCATCPDYDPVTTTAT